MLSSTNFTLSIFEYFVSYMRSPSYPSFRSFTVINVNPASIYMFKVSNGNFRTRYDICLKLPIKTPERLHWRRLSVFVVNVENISYLFLVFVLLTLNKLKLFGKFKVKMVSLYLFWIKLKLPLVLFITSKLQ